MNTFDLIINLVVRNQDAIKSIGQQLKALEAFRELSKIVIPEINIPEPTIVNAIKFGKQIHDVAPIATAVGEALGPTLVEGLINATESLSRMAQSATEVGHVSIGADFDPNDSIGKGFERARESARGFTEELGQNLSRAARESAESIDDVADSVSRVKAPSQADRPTFSAPQISLSPQVLDDTIELFDAIKATYNVTNQLAQALDKAGGSRSGQINAIAQALAGVSRLVGAIYGVSVNFNDKELRAIATSIVGLVKPLKDVGIAAIGFKDSISMAGLDPSKWISSYEKAAKDLTVVLGGVGKVAIELRKNLSNADGDTASILSLLDLKELQAGLGNASQKAAEFKKSFDLNDIPKTILATAKATDEVARSLQAVFNGKNPFESQSDNKGLEILKGTIGQVVEKFRELQGVKLPQLNSKDAVQLAQALGTTSDKAKQLQQDLNLRPQSIVTALNELNRFGSVNLPLREQFKILNAEMGITKQQFAKLKDLQSGGVEKASVKLPQQLEPIASKVIDFGLGKVDGDARILVQTLRAVSEKLQEIKSGVNFKPLPTNEAVAFAQALGTTAAQARSLQKDLNLPTGTITSALSSIKQFESVKLPLKEQFQTLNKELGITKDQFDKIKQIKDLAPEDKTGLGLAKTFEGVSKVAFGYNQITTAVGSMVARVNPAYAAMIGANEELNQQLLKSAATITATSVVSGADGAKLGNLESIRALQPALKSTIREVEIATQSLVGVTSQQTSEVFNVILQNTGQLNGQLKSATDQAQRFKDPLDAAAKLAPGMVATLGTLGLPLAQASDEIGNLLKGEIDQTAQVAKSLGITKQMVETWKSQGTLVDQLTKRFDPFLKANAEASRSVSGITSNIQDMFEIMNREAGKPVTALYVDALEGVYKYLQAVMPKVQEVFTNIIQQQVTTIQTVAGSMKPLFDGIMTAVTALAPTIEPAIRSSLGLIVALFKTLEPVFGAVGQVIGALGKALAAMMPFIIQANAIFGVLASTTFNIGIALTALGAPLQILVAGITAVAGAIEKIAKDPLGGILIQAIGLTVVLAPLVNTLLSLGATIAAIGGFSAWLPGAIAGIQTLVIVASSFLPFGGAISAALAKATLAVNSFFAAVIAGAKPPLLIDFLKGAIVEIGLFAKAMLAKAIPATIALAKELGIFAVQIIPRVIAGFAAMQTGGITAGFAALSAGLPILSGGFAGLAAATNLAAAAATKLLLAYGPLLVVVAAVGVTLLAKSAKDLADVNQELEDVSKTNNAISDAALKTTEKLKKLQEAQSKGGLSAAQKNELKDALFAGKQQIALIDDQIAANKKLREDSQKRGANEEQLSTFDRLIKDKEREKEALSKLANEIKIASQPLAELGTTSEQMAQKVRSATRLIEAGVGDPTKYAAAAKELTGLLQKQVELGQTTADEAAKQLVNLKNNTKLDYESQLAAKEAIVKIYSDRFAKIDELQSSGKLSNSAAEAELQQVQQNTDLEVKTRQEAGKKIIALRKETMEAELAELAAGTAKIEAQKAQGTIGEAEAARQTSAIKVQESQKRLEQLKKEADLETNPEVKRKLVADVQKTESEITKIKADEINRRNAERLKDFDEQGKILQAELDTGRISEEKFNEAKRTIDKAQAAEEIKQLTEKLGKLKSTDKEGREAINAQIAEAESKREAARKAANEREIAALEKNLQTQLAMTNAYELQRQLLVAQGLREGSISKEKADVESARSAKAQAEAEVDAAQQRLDKLRSLAPPSQNESEYKAFKLKELELEGKISKSRLDSLSKNSAIENALVAELAAANQKANEKIQAAREAFRTRLGEEELQALKKKGFDLEEINRSIASKSLSQDQKDADAQYKAKLDQINKLKTLRLEDDFEFQGEKYKGEDLSPEFRKEVERKLQKELSDINLQRISLEKKALEELRAEKVRQIELESQNSINPLQKKIDLLTQQKTILEQQNALISAQDRLESASFNLAKQRTGFAIEDAKAAKDEQLVKQLETQAASDQLTFTRQQNISKIESVKLSIEQRTIDTEMAQLNAEIATIQSKANLEKAIAEGKSKEVIEALRREVALRGKQEDLAGKAVENQKTIGGKELRAAQIEAQTAEERDIRALNKAGGNQSAPIVPTQYIPGQGADRFERKSQATDKPSEAESKAAERLADAITRSINGEAPRKVGADQPIGPKKASKPETSRDPLAPSGNIPEGQRPDRIQPGTPSDPVKGKIDSLPEASKVAAKSLQYFSDSVKNVGGLGVADFGKALDGAAVAANKFAARLEGSQVPSPIGANPNAPQPEQRPQRSAGADPVSNAINPLTSAVQSNTQALKDGGTKPGQTIDGGQAQQNQVIGGGQIQPNQVVGGGVSNPPIDEATKKLEAETATAADSNKKLGESSTTAANAITKLTTSFQSATPGIPIPARFTGGPVSAGMTFTGAEMGPELARYEDGSYDMLMQPGIYNLSKAAQIIPAHETQQILQNSSMMSNSTIVNAGGLIDNSDVIHELRQLRSIITNRRPMVSNNVTFDRPSSDGTDRAFAEFSRMLVRAI